MPVSATTENGDPLVSTVVERAELDESDINAMWSLYAAYYDGTDKALFRSDLAKKSHVLLSRDGGGAGEIRGFSTIELDRQTFQGREIGVGRSFHHGCHPNVVMINAIDEQHFRTVHRVPGHLLDMRPEAKSRRVIEFANTARLPRSTAFFRWASRFYAGPLRYELTYWYGSNGVVTMGPDFLHLYILFALRQTPEGTAEGQTVVFTKRRRSPLGWLIDRAVLLLTKIAGNYFSAGDTKVFDHIRFDYRTPVAADRAVQVFMAHLEKQTLVKKWHE